MLEKENLVCQFCLSRQRLECVLKQKEVLPKRTEAIDEAYHIGDTLIFLREYPTENAALDGKLQSENPKILEALKR